MSDTVKVSSSLPGDWGARKADAMHEQLAKAIDKQLARAEERKAARAERKAKRGVA